MSEIRRYIISGIDTGYMNYMSYRGKKIALKKIDKFPQELNLSSETRYLTQPAQTAPRLYTEAEVVELVATVIDAVREKVSSDLWGLSDLLRTAIGTMKPFYQTVSGDDPIMKPAGLHEFSGLPGQGMVRPNHSFRPLPPGIRGITYRSEKNF